MKHVLDEGAHWCHLANRIEPSMCIGDAALCQITLTTCYLHYLLESFSAVLTILAISVSGAKMGQF